MMYLTLPIYIYLYTRILSLQEIKSVSDCLLKCGKEEISVLYLSRSIEQIKVCSSFF